MTAIFKKLKNKVGESLVESLCAILIFTMASVVMFSMVSSAADINGKAKEQDKKNQTYMVAVEKGENRSGRGTVTFTFGSNVHLDVDVDVYGDKDTLFAYFMAPQGG